MDPPYSALKEKHGNGKKKRKSYLDGCSCPLLALPQELSDQIPLITQFSPSGLSRKPWLSVTGSLLCSAPPVLTGVLGCGGAGSGSQWLVEGLSHGLGGSRMGWLRVSVAHRGFKPAAGPGFWADLDHMVRIFSAPGSLSDISWQWTLARCRLKMGHRSAVWTALLWSIREK